jgi:hypothetical protein
MNRISTASPPRIVALSTRLYTWLLGLYPPRYRVDYAQPMAQVFRDCCREAYYESSAAGVVRLWLATLVDLGVSAPREWFAGKPDPGRYIFKLGIGLAAGMAGGLAAGLGARLSMRGVALVAGLEPGFTVAGTLGIALAGVIVGMPLGALFVALRRALPGEGVWKGCFYGLCLVVVGMVPTILFYREGEFVLAPPLVGLALFAPLGPLYGAALAVTARRLDGEPFPHGHATATASARPRAIGRQVIAVATFAGLLELGVLGAGSITHHIPLLPPAVVHALQEHHIPFSQVRVAHVWLVNLFALGYFGLSSLIFWQRARRPMARFAAASLLLFGGALFNTGARYYTHLSIDPVRLQPLFHGLQVAGCTALVALFYCFPNGRLAAPWLRPIGLSWLFAAGAWLFTPQLPEALAALILCIYLGAGGLAQLQRSRAASPDEQAQLRWPTRGFIAACAGLALAALVLIALPDLKLPKVAGLSAAATFAPYMLPWLSLPLTIGYAMWRHRLWAA